MSTGTPVVVSRIQNRRGTQDQFDALYPVGYAGEGGYESIDFPTFTQAAYPNVLRSGELALCTDTRKMFMGNINGEYISIYSGPSDPIYTALQVALPTSTGVFTPIPALTYSTTPFLSILYSVTNATGPTTGVPALPTAVGPTFSRNGELKITAKQYAAPTDATLTDTSTDFNGTAYDISFKAEYISSSAIQISYTHNFPDYLTLSTNTIIWFQVA